MLGRVCGAEVGCGKIVWGNVDSEVKLVGWIVDSIRAVCVRVGRGSRSRVEWLVERLADRWSAVNRA